MKYILLVLSILIVGVFSVNINIGNVDLSTAVNATPAECELCGFICSYIEGMIIHNNKTQGEIVTEVEKLCKFVKPEIRNTCDSLVNEYTNQIVQAIVNKVTPDQICGQIVKLCPNTNIASTQLTKPIQLVMGEPNSCVLCESIVNKLEGLVANENTKDEITSELNIGCKIFGRYSNSCESMVKTFLPELIQLFESSYSANNICKECRLCK